jgi:hypothetical protein
MSKENERRIAASKWALPRYQAAQVGQIETISANGAR